MRLFAEERKNHTLKLLLTKPISTLQIVLGKFLFTILFILIILACTLVYPLILILTGNPDLGPIFTSIIGTILLSCCHMSIGMFFSSITSNQVIAGAVTFVTCLFFWLVSWAAQSSSGVMSSIFQYLSIIGHFENFSRGVLSTSDLIYLISFSGVFVFLCYRVVDSYRWREN